MTTVGAGALRFVIRRNITSSSGRRGISTSTFATRNLNKLPPPSSLRVWNRNNETFRRTENHQQLIIVRCLMVSSPRLHDLEGASKEFKQAVTKIEGVREVDNRSKLKLYALFKQSTQGVNTKKKPGVFDVVGKAKWEAWKALGDMSQEDAEKQYIALVNELAQQAGGDSSASSEPSSEEAEGLLITTQNGIRTITLNRPKKKNALNLNMYQTITRTLKESNDDAAVNIVVLTGAGDYFCSGNDLANFMNVSDPAAMAKAGRDILQEYVGSYIDLKKPLIALINGPAVGIAVTVLGLCDSVFATDKASFTTPFSSLGQSPEACSSYTFPRIMGYAKASELLYFNQKLTAKQAEEQGLVTKVFPDDRVQAEAWQRIKEMAELPVKSLIYSKDLVRGREREILHEVNRLECERLEERWVSDDCINAIMKFFSKRAKM